MVRLSLSLSLPPEEVAERIEIHRLNKKPKAAAASVKGGAFGSGCGSREAGTG